MSSRVFSDDQLLLSNISQSYFTEKPLWNLPYTFRNKQRNYISATQPVGVLRDRYVKFDFSKVDGQWVCPKDFVYANCITVKSTSGTNPFDTNTLISVKSSLASLVTGLALSFNGRRIVTQDNLALFNNIKLLSERDTIFYDARGKEILFVKDDQRNAVAQKIVNTVSGSGVTSGVVDAVKVASPPYTSDVLSTAANRGFTERCSAMKALLVSSTSNVLTFLVFIPLMYVSEIFDNWCVPITNSGMEVQIDHGFNQDSNQPWPIMTETTTDAATVEIDSSYLGGARMYYYRYDFWADDEAQLSKKLSDGWNYSIDFETVVEYKVYATNSTATSFTPNDTDKVYRPTAIVAMFPPTGQLRSQNLPDIMYNSTKLTYAQTKINGVPYYDSAPMLDEDHWLLFKERFNGQQALTSSSCVSKEEWMQKMRIYIHPLHRLKDIKNQISSGYAIDSKFTRSDTSAIDVYILVLGIQSLDFRFTHGGVDVSLRDANLS